MPDANSVANRATPRRHCVPSSIDFPRPTAFMTRPGLGSVIHEAIKPGFG